jgi:hypothetical protein
VFEQGDSSGKALVVDLSLSSDEEGLIPDTSCDEEFARRLFVDLNYDVVGGPVTATSSSSATLMKKKRCARKMPPMPKLCLLLLQGS